MEKVSLKKTLPNIVTKKLMIEIYSGYLSRRTIQVNINSHIRILGWNTRKKIIPEIVLITFIKHFGLPEGYILSEKRKENLDKINRP